MESLYSTPVSVTAKKTRRRAISPADGKSPYSSPFQVIDLNAETNESLKKRLLETESLMEDLRKEQHKLDEDLMTKSGLNESFIIERSNRVSTQETRIYRRDLSVLEEELKQKNKQVRLLQDRVAELEKSNQNLLEDLQSFHDKQKDSDEGVSRLRQELHELEKRLHLKESTVREMRDEALTREREFKQEKTIFETELDKMRLKLDQMTSKLKEETFNQQKHDKLVEDLRNKLTQAERDLDLQKELVRSSGDELTNQMRRSIDNENEEIMTNKKVLSEVREIANKMDYLTPIRKASTDDKEELSKFSVKLAEENIAGLRKKVGRLTRELAEKKELADSLQTEIDELRKTMDETIGCSDQTNRFLHDENARLTLQKAEIRCELIEVKRNFENVGEKIRKLEEEKENALKKIDTLKEEKRELEKELRRLKESLNERSEEMEEMQDKLAELECLKKQNENMKGEVARIQEKYNEMGKHLIMVDEQCTRYKNDKETADRSKRRAIEQCNDMVSKIRGLEGDLEKQRKIENELEELKAVCDRQASKIEYLQSEIQETHLDYRQELGRLAAEKGKEADKDQIEMVSRLKLNVSQKESEMRSLKKMIDELKTDNTKLQEQLTAVRNQQETIVEENVRLRKGLADAVAKIQGYKNDYESMKEQKQRIEEEVKEKEKKMIRLEDELADKSQQVTESQQVVNYLHTQINTKPTKQPKLPRRSTLLNTISEPQMDLTAFQRESEEVRILEEEKMELLRNLTEKKRQLAESKSMNATTTTITQTKTKSIVQTSKSESELQGERKVIMRHDIPHKWKDVRHLGVLSLKCVLCFVGIPTLGKYKKCAHCDVQVHCACSPKVNNTCGMPVQCGIYYKDNHTTVPSAVSEGRMNGWMRVYRDDLNGSGWISSWTMMDLSRIAFYTNDGTDLDKPFFAIDLNREQWVVRVGMELPIECDDKTTAHNVIHIKMPRRNLYILAPSQNSARRWSDCLQLAQKKRMMLTSRPSSMAEFTCLLCLNATNKLTIFKAYTTDDWIMFATQTGLFYTSISQPRSPMRIAGPNSVTAIEVMPDINCAVMVINSNCQLAIAPLDSLQLAMQSTQPSIRPEILPEFVKIAYIKYHQQNGHKFLVVSDPTHLHILKYNSTRDVFSHFAKFEVPEPVLSVESTPQGIIYCSDTFYYVQLDNQRVQPIKLVRAKDGDYPICSLIISDSEFLLAYQNYGVFVDINGRQTRNGTIEWEKLPMEFYYTAPYLFVVHFDSIVIMEVADYTGPDSKTVLADREVFECENARIIGRHLEAVLISVSSSDSTEVHRFNTAYGPRRNMVNKRRGQSPFNTLKRTKN